LPSPKAQDHPNIALQCKRSDQEIPLSEMGFMVNLRCENSKPRMSQLGSKADLTAPKSDFRFTPESGLKTDIAPCPFGAKRRHRKFGLE
jgi:hypothetical protein